MMRTSALIGQGLVLLGLQSAYAFPTKRTDLAYDYVIVGGGTAGLVMADRLSESGEYTVAVIEAGSLYEIGDPVLASTPAGDVFFCGAAATSTDPLVDWDFETEPQTGASDRVVHYARGKCLGGSSARNFMIYQRPTTGSLQQWAEAVDDDSYTFDEWLPFFKKSVTFYPPSDDRAANATAEYNADAFEASGEPLTVSYANYAGPFSSWIQGSLNEIGIATTEDFNSGSLMGAQYCSSTINPSDENRESSQTSFLNAAINRTNLDVYTLTMAKQILFNSDKNATGVTVTSADLVTYNITANKEVIVSAGAFQSPQMLMVSGIGPAATLESLDIPVISDLAGVGQNMWDHVFFGPTYRVDVQTFTKLANDLVYVLEQFATDYELNQTGPLTNPVCDFLAWEKVPSDADLSATATAQLAAFASDWPNIEYLSAPGYVGDFSDLPSTQPKDGYQYATILAAIVSPLSRGNVTITSADTNDLPLINPNWLTSTTDQEVGIAAFKRTREAFASNYMSGVLADDVEYYPGPSAQTDAEILEVIQNSLQTVWHASATCKMGLESDSTAVVDNRARVFGVTGLRVVDASAAPFLPPGHPQSWIYALAEKISYHILNGD